MKSKLREISFLEPLYFVDISYLYGGEFSDLKNFIHERHGDAQMFSFGEKFDWTDDADTTDAYQFHIPALHGKGERFYVWVHLKTIYLLAHETFHLTGDILYHRGLKYSMDSEEAFAYLHGYIFQEMFKLMKGKI